jgi:hypothetical protein
MKKRKKSPPIKIVVGFGEITKEKVEALPESVKDQLGRLLYDFFMQLAEQETERAVKMAA